MSTSKFCQLTILVSLLTMSGLGISGCGECDSYHSTFTVSGSAYRSSDSSRTFGIDYTNDDCPRFNELFLDAEGNEGFLHSFSIYRPMSDLTDTAFFIDFTVPVGAVVTGTQGAGGGACLEVAPKIDGIPSTSINGGLTIDDTRVSFTEIQATILDKSPPTADLVFRGVDDSGEAWVVELHLVSGRAGNAPTCD